MITHQEKVTIKRHYSLEGRVDVTWNNDGSTAVVTFPSCEEIAISMSAQALKMLLADIDHGLRAGVAPVPGRAPWRRQRQSQ